MGFQKTSFGIKFMIFEEHKLFELLREWNVKAAREYMSLHIPDTLTKFYSLTHDEKLNDKKIETLANNCNWFDYSYNQNDPFDMRMIYVDKEAVLKAGLPHEAYELEKNFLEELKRKLLICSFVDSDYNNLPMWAYYANNHRGYCVRYKVNRKGMFFRVLYSETSGPITSLFLQYLASCDAHAEDKCSEMIRATYEYAIQVFLSTKHLSWKHENEYRIIFPQIKDISNRISNRMAGLEILDITVGLNCEEKYKQKILQIASAKKIPCYQICLDNKNFLVREQLGGIRN